MKSIRVLFTATLFSLIISKTNCMAQTKDNKQVSITNQNPVYVFATWNVKEGEIDTVLNLLMTVRDESIKENGNLFYKIHQSNSDSNTLILFEGYKNEAALEEHRNTSHFQELVLEQIVPLLENRAIVLTTLLE